MTSKCVGVGCSVPSARPPKGIQCIEELILGDGILELCKKFDRFLDLHSVLRSFSDLTIEWVPSSLVQYFENSQGKGLTSSCCPLWISSTLMDLVRTNSFTTLLQWLANEFHGRLIGCPPLGCESHSKDCIVAGRLIQPFCWRATNHWLFVRGSERVLATGSQVLHH
jgi:hypothetical protein